MDLASIFSNEKEKGKTHGEYLQALEEEKKKIQVFHRELPLSLHLVNFAIESFRRHAAAELFLPRVEEEPISDGAPSLEEFLPLKPDSNEDEESEDNGGKKRDWLKSVQLWTPHSDEETNRSSWVHDSEKGKRPATTFLSFLPQKSSAEMSSPAAAAAPPPPQTASSTSESRGAFGSNFCAGEEKRSQNQRKARRCWSQDLHRRFLEALNQLGGTEVATPKRIREIMKEDSLTNDEVKSHLQKYRLHSRRPSQPAQSKSNSPQQVVFVGGVWIPGYGT